MNKLMNRRRLKLITYALAALILVEALSSGYTFRMLISLDQTVNTLFDGDPDDTISARLGRSEANGDWFASNIACPFLDLFDDDHCAKSGDIPPYDKD